MKKKVKLNYHLKSTLIITLQVKKKDFFVRDYLNHFKTYGFNWEDNKIGLRYFVKKVGTKVQKRLTLSQNSRKMIVLDEQRIFNVHNSVKRDLSDIKKIFLTIAMAYYGPHTIK